MGKYILKRILIAIPVLIGITVIDYTIMCLAGSPLEMLQGPRVSEAAVEAKRIALGLDQPVLVQYFVWLGELLQGNMGYSMKSFQPVSAMIGSHIGPTLLLMGVSLLVSLLLAVPAGIYSAIRQYSKGDYAVVTASFLGSSVPGFFLSLLLIYLFTVKLGWLPSSGMTTLGTQGGAADVAKHMVMPVTVLAFYPLYQERDAGDPAAGLSADGESQGNRTVSCHQQTRPAQCAGADHYGHRHGDSDAVWRSGHYRAGVLLAGAWPDDDERYQQPGFSGDHGSLPVIGYCGAYGKSGDGYSVCAGGSDDSAGLE